MGYITQNYQKDVLQAIFKEANELGYTVFCFANFGAYGDKVLYAEGERGIMYLPDLTQLDGIIVGEDTFDVPGMGNEIYVYLKKNADCPVVYLRGKRGILSCGDGRRRSDQEHDPTFYTNPRVSGCLFYDRSL